MFRILYIEDEPGLLLLFTVILERAGYKVLATTSSKEALNILDCQSVDLVIQDFHRVEMNGYEFLKHMKENEQLRDIPVVAVTAGGKAGRNRHLKPLGLDR